MVKAPAPSSFVSSLPYEAARIYAAAVYCSDGRIGDHVDDFLHNGLGLPRYDRVACPGGPVALSGRFPYLSAGDVVELEIEGLGRQRQRFVAA